MTKTNSNTPLKMPPSTTTNSHLLQVPPAKKPTGAAAKRAAKAGKKNSSDASEIQSQGTSAISKKRGRKREKWEKYVSEAKQKIDFYKGKLATAKRDKVDVKLR